MKNHFVIFLDVMVVNLYRQWDLLAIAKVVLIAGFHSTKKSFWLEKTCKIIKSNWLYVEEKGETVKLRLSLRVDIII